MDDIELLGLRAAEPDALLGDDAETGFLEHGVDGAGEVTLGRVGFQDGKRAFEGHWVLQVCFKFRRDIPPAVAHGK